MDLDRISIEPRLRTPWEAIDLGFVMARHWWKPLLLSWAVPAVIVFFIVALIAPNHSWLTYFIVWWLKPLLDRGPLFIASRRLFGEEASARDVFRNLWRLYKTDIFLWLTIRRLSPTRAFDMPLTVLEKLKGQQRSNRQGLMHRNHSSAASWLTIAGIHIESFLSIGFVSFIAIMIPSEVGVNFLDVFVEHDQMITWAGNIATLIAMCLAGPFYALAGFALYLSRRIDLEAWDVEIRFRHLAMENKRKLDISSLKSSLAVLCVVFCTATFGFSSYKAVADEVVSQPESESHVTIETQGWPKYERDVPLTAEGEEAKNTIIEVLTEKEFHKVKHVSGWRFKNAEQSGPEAFPDWFVSVVEWLVDHSDFLSGLAKILAIPLQYIEYILWALLIVIILYVLYKYRKPISNFVSSVEPVDDDHQSPNVMFGLDVSKESLPDDVPAAVWKLWEQGESREAVSLFYRALLAGLIHQHDFRFADSHTEGECVTIVKSRGDKPLATYVYALTNCWQQLAYGHIAPATSDIQTLCGKWYEVFPNE